MEFNSGVKGLILLSTLLLLILSVMDEYILLIFQMFTAYH